MKHEKKAEEKAAKQEKKREKEASKSLKTSKDQQTQPILINNSLNTSNATSSGKFGLYEEEGDTNEVFADAPPSGIPMITLRETNNTGKT